MVYINLYSSLESIAFFMKIILQINNNDTNNQQEKSEFEKVGEFLKINYQGDELFSICYELFDNKQFQQLIDFRGTWVHSQRIVLKDEPLPMKRKSLWKENEKYFIQEFGSKPPSSYNFDIFEYSQIIKEGYQGYVRFFDKVLIYFQNKLSKELKVSRVEVLNNAVNLVKFVVENKAKSVKVIGQDGKEKEIYLSMLVSMNWDEN